ncbi:hypothetical protein [Enterococcus lactis]|uniref:hypothetical protein n=1 Tax=Enterococcus lactis TaxID=357441 RepID=UPI0040427F77
MKTIVTDPMSIYLDGLQTRTRNIAKRLTFDFLDLANRKVNQVFSNDYEGLINCICMPRIYRKNYIISIPRGYRFKVKLRRDSKYLRKTISI